MPVTVTNTIVSLNKKTLGAEFKKDQIFVVRFFDEASNETKAQLAKEFSENGSIKIQVQDDKEFTLDAKHVTFSEQ